MIFNRERGIRRDSPKQDVLALEPTARIQTAYEITGRIFFVCLGERTLSSSISSHGAWSKALKKLLHERENRQ